MHINYDLIVVTAIVNYTLLFATVFIKFHCDMLHKIGRSTKISADLPIQHPSLKF